jgi:hypothetical protein
MSYQQSARIKRALSQRLYLLKERCSDENDETVLNFEVMGASGSAYEVEYALEDDQASWSCTCPDHLQRDVLCKHIYFVMYKVLNQPYVDGDMMETVEDWLKAKQQILDRETHVIVKNTAKEKPKQETKGVRQRPYIGETCAICLDPMEAGTPVTYCQTTCGNSVHQDCFKRWSIHRKSSLCVHCRQDMWLA